MVGIPESRLVELRFLEGIEKVEHVPYPTGDQFWVRFNQPLDLGKLGDIAAKHKFRMVKFAGIPSKLPRGLAEMLWNGVTHIIVRKISGWASFTASLGFEPEGIAKIAADLHGPYQIFIATDEEGVQILYEYLGLKYVPLPPPSAPPKPVIPAKPAAPAIAEPSLPATPRPPTSVGPATTNHPAQAKPASEQPSAQAASPVVETTDAAQAQAAKKEQPAQSSG